ncbi:MAG: helix-turn-helix transcriptional regulator [Victivallales bacterium]|nr:helix-turn-helix transcriptional regulator [Victivallales bacterium]
MNLPEILGENIAQRRKKLGLSQKQVAERLGVTPEAMTRIEKGKIAPKLTRLEAIARILQCSVPALFRKYSDDAQERSAIIADAISGVPSEYQQAIVNLVLEAVRLIDLPRDT